MSVTPTQDGIIRTLGNFIVKALPGTTVIQSQVNRVPQPKSANFVVMTPLRRVRLATNFDDYIDCVFTASISGTTMTVTNVAQGVVLVGAVVFGAGIVSPPTIVSQTSGLAGGAGVYVIDSAPGAIASEKMASGSAVIVQSTQIAVQLDVYGPASGDNVQIVSTLFRDEYASQAFEASGFDVVPLYTNDPVQGPFIDEEKQYEDRWVLEVEMQANQTVAVSQQFADQLIIGLISVDERYPAQSP